MKLSSNRLTNRITDDIDSEVYTTTTCCDCGHRVLAVKEFAAEPHQCVECYREGDKR